MIDKAQVLGPAAIVAHLADGGCGLDPAVRKAVAGLPT
jgi:hypothetical protein